MTTASWAATSSCRRSSATRRRSTRRRTRRSSSCRPARRKWSRSTTRSGPTCGSKPLRRKGPGDPGPLFCARPPDRILAGEIMSDVELCYLTATDALKLFKAKKLSPVELMSAVIARAEKIQSKLKPFTFTHFDEAMDLAKQAETKYAKGAKTGALEGLPIGIKDESFIAGKPTSFGSLITKDFVPDTTSPNNERIMRAGGI